MTCAKERSSLQEARSVAEDARAEYEDQKQLAGEAAFFADFYRLNILSATFSGSGALWAIVEKSVSALEKQGTAERAVAKALRARRAADRADERVREAREAVARCLDAHEVEPVEFTLSSTLTLRARFLEEKILPPQGLSGTLPARETTDTVVARCAAFQRHARGFHSTVATLDDEYTAAVSNSTVYDDRGRPTTHTLTEQVTAVKPGTLAVEIGYHGDEDNATFWVRLGRDEKPLRSGQQTLTTRDPDGGCHTLALPYANVPSVWPGVFKALRRKDERFTSERIVIFGRWTWTAQGDLGVATRRWSTEPGPLATGPSGEMFLVAENSSIEVKLRRRPT
jgi:hypothetical protein